MALAPEQIGPLLLAVAVTAGLGVILVVLLMVVVHDAGAADVTLPKTTVIPPAGTAPVVKLPVPLPFSVRVCGVPATIKLMVAFGVPEKLITAVCPGQVAPVVPIILAVGAGLTVTVAEVVAEHPPVLVTRA